MKNQKSTTVIAVTIATTPSIRMSIPTARPTSLEHVHNVSSDTCSVVSVVSVVSVAIA